MKQCNQCAAEIAPGEEHEFGGETLCEDCYLDRVATPKTCDPWAVYTAKKTAATHQQLTPVQEKILKLLQENGPLPASEICSQLNITEIEFRSNFAALRHMEKARACKLGDQVCYTLFDDPTN